MATLRALAQQIERGDDQLDQLHANLKELAADGNVRMDRLMRALQRYAEALLTYREHQSTFRDLGGKEALLGQNQLFA